MDCSLLGFSVCEIFQETILKWVKKNFFLIVFFTPMPRLGRSGSELDFFDQVRLCDNSKKFPEMASNLTLMSRKVSSLGLKFPHL